MVKWLLCVLPFVPRGRRATLMDHKDDDYIQPFMSPRIDVVSDITTDAPDQVISVVIPRQTTPSNN